MSLSESARTQGGLWGARAEGWADQEERELPRYEAVLDRIDVAGKRVLDVGCGSGVFLRAAADRGAQVTGVDAAESLLAIARRRVPEAEIRFAEMEALPFGDDEFDLVCGFNSFFFAADITAALREAARVAKPGGHVAAQVWGRAERCDLTPMLRAMGALRGAAPPAGPALSDPGVLEGIAVAAGLTPQTTFDLVTAMEYPDEPTLLRCLTSPGGVTAAIEAAGEEAVRDAILTALEPHRTGDGGWRAENEWHYVIASA